MFNISSEAINTNQATMSAVACTAMFVMSLPADQFCTEVFVLISNNRISPFELESKSTLINHS